MIRQLITMVAVLGIAASTQAGISTEYTVDDAGHLLDGAVFVTSIDGADTWTESVGAPGEFGAAGSNASLTIADASGDGAAWNGVYSYYDGTGGFSPFAGAYQDSSASYGTSGIAPDQAAAAYWEDGAGNQLYFLVGMLSGATVASEGAAVVQDNFGSYAGVYLQSVAGTNDSFSGPTGGIGSVTVIPEPAVMGMMMCFGVATFAIRRIFIL